MGKKSRDKGSRTERNLVSALRDIGLDAHRVDNKRGQLGSTDSYDVEVRSSVDSSVEYKLEVKCRANGFKTLYLKADNKPFLIVRKLEAGVL